MITLPKITSARSGLTFRYRTWAARYYDGGKQRFRSLGTSDLAAAQIARDRLYDELRAAGATTAGPGHRPKGGSYITERPPFVVRVPGRKIRYAASRGQAEEIRDQLLWENANNPNDYAKS